MLSGITAPFGRVQALDAIPESRVRYLSIPHPFATIRLLSYPIKRTVRLACLSHAASVRSEPGSNSSLFIADFRLSALICFWLQLKSRSRNETTGWMSPTALLYGRRFAHQFKTSEPLACCSDACFPAALDGINC